jgi:AcrR family transcriptional regulator
VSQARARGPYAKTAARRADIVRAARDSFAEHGYAQSSLRDIAERAGITHTGLLHHFRTKDELLAAVLAQRDTEEWEQGSAEVSDIDSLPSFLGDLLRRHQETPELMRLWAELAVAASRSDHPAHAYFVDRYERARSRTAQIMREGASRGEQSEALDADSGAMIFHAVLYGLQVQWLLNPQLDIVEALNSFLKLILPTGTAARPESASSEAPDASP